MAINKPAMRVFFCLTVLLAFSAAAPLQESGLEGRWLFQIFLENGNDKVAVFIAEIGREEGETHGQVISSTADMEFTVPRVVLQERILQLDVQSERGTLSFTGELKDKDLIQGTVSGGAFQNRPFVAERTQLSEMGRPKPPSRDERLAFQRARSLADFDERISALQAFIRNNSQSQLKEEAYEQIFMAHLYKKSSDDEVLRAADAWGVNAQDRFKTLNEIAASLADKTRLLDFAERVSDGLLERFGDQSPPKYFQTRARVAVKKGEHRKALEVLERALKLDQDNGETLQMMAEAWEALNDQDQAEGYYLRAFLETGNRLSLTRLERFYKARHGSLEGLHERIDAAYERRPPLFEAGRYEGPEPRQVVLLELFTGSECGPCQASDYAFDGLLEHFPDQAMAALQYHLHIPGPDPMTTPESVERARYYGVHSTPDAYFGGNSRRVGGSKRDRASLFFRDYKDLVQKRLDQPSPLEIGLEGRVADGVVYFTASVRARGQVPVEDLRLRVALVEAQVHYTGVNGVHFHRNVVRTMLPDAAGSALAQRPDSSEDPDGDGESAALGQIQGSLVLAELEKGLGAYLDAYQKKNGRRLRERVEHIDPGGLRLIAFVQNDKTREVLQAAIASLHLLDKPTSTESQ